MDAKQFLRQVRYLDDLIDTKLEQIQELRSLAEKVTSTLSLDGTSLQSSGQDKIGDLVARIVDLQMEIEKATSRMIDIKTKAMRLIDNMPTPEHRLLLQMRYLRGLTWEQIAVDMAYTYRGIHYLHSRALREFEEVRQDNLS